MITSNFYVKLNFKAKVAGYSHWLIIFKWPVLATEI